MSIISSQSSSNGSEPEPEFLFDERRWEKIETWGDGYSPRTGHTVVAYETSLYVFGGTDRRRRQQDLFQYDIESSSWSMVNAAGPLPPRRSGALGITYGSKMYIFGGYDGRDGNYFNDLFFFNFETRAWSEMPSRPGQRPEARTDHIMVLHQEQIYVFGGYDGHTRYQNMYAYDLRNAKWELKAAKGTVPSRRFGHSGTVHEKSNSLIVFGGWDGKDTLNDLFSYDFEDQCWTKRSTHGVPPPHRYRHTSVIFEDSMFVFGGVDKQHCRYNDLQRLDLRTNVWSQVCTTGYVPSSRTFHRAVVVGNLMYLLGGYDGTDRLHDLYSIHVGTLTPASLLSICTTYVRRNYRRITANRKLDNVPLDLVNWAIWQRDGNGVLRSNCKHCPRERCANYEKARVRRKMQLMQQHLQLKSRGILVGSNNNNNSTSSEIRSPSFTFGGSSSSNGVTDGGPIIEAAGFLGSDCACTCGHSSSEHYKVDENVIYSKEMLKLIESCTKPPASRC